MNQDDLKQYAQESANEDDLLPLLNEWSRMQSEKATLETELKAVQARITRLETEDIPEKMKDIGFTAGNLPGYKVSLHKGTNVAIRKDQKENALEWLEEHGLDWMIKTTVQVPFDKGDDTTELEELLQKEGYTFIRDRGVHPQTLKAQGSRLANAQKNAVKFPEELFSVHDYNKANIKPIANEDNEDF